VTESALFAIETFMEEQEGRDHALDHLDQWDEADVHQLVSAFLGIRFPITVALNKSDLPGSAQHIREIQEALPIHGTHVGVQLCARKEMNFVKHSIEKVLDSIRKEEDVNDATVPQGTWQCLQSAIALREPILVFPVSDFERYTPLAGLSAFAVKDPSLPSPGMIECLNAAGGSAPTRWDPGSSSYVASRDKKDVSLRDAIMMKRGSTVEDVFSTLKKLGAASGEFVRAEGAGRIGDPPRPVPKHQIVTKETRILKIMTSKRAAWQNS
jgi:hypothetical protein